MTVSAPQRSVKNVREIIAQAARAAHLDPDVLKRFAEIESGFIPSAVNKTTGAAGLFQFMPETWAGLGIGGSPLNIEDAAKGAALLARQNIRALRGSGYHGPIGGTELYMMHFLGSGAGPRFLKQLQKNPLANAAEIFSKEAASNPNIFYRDGKPATLQDVFNRAAGRMQEAPHLLWPSKERTVTSDFGHRSAPVAGASTHHPGVDFGAPQGSAIVSVLPGTVQSVNRTSAGVIIEIGHDNGLKTRYLHTTSPAVKAGQKILAGQTIAVVGPRDEHSTGAHLHFELYVNNKRQDPLPFLKRNNVPEMPENGYDRVLVSYNPNDVDNGDNDTGTGDKMAVTWQAIHDELKETGHKELLRHAYDAGWRFEINDKVQTPVLERADLAKGKNTASIVIPEDWDLGRAVRYATWELKQLEKISFDPTLYVTRPVEYKQQDMNQLSAGIVSAQADTVALSSPLPSVQIQVSPDRNLRSGTISDDFKTVTVPGGLGRGWTIYSATKKTAEAQFNQLSSEDQSKFKDINDFVNQKIEVVAKLNSEFAKFLTQPRTQEELKKIQQRELAASNGQPAKPVSHEAFNPMAPVPAPSKSTEKSATNTLKRTPAEQNTENALKKRREHHRSLASRIPSTAEASKNAKGRAALPSNRKLPDRWPPKIAPEPKPSLERALQVSNKLHGISKAINQINGNAPVHAPIPHAPSAPTLSLM